MESERERILAEKRHDDLVKKLADAGISSKSVRCARVCARLACCGVCYRVAAAALFFRKNLPSC